jgi:dihydroflavonol-4-reductase
MIFYNLTGSSTALLMILVTGGTGLVGTHLLLELTRSHDRIRAIYRPMSDTRHVLDVFGMYLGDPGIQYRKIEWVPADITDVDSLLEALEGVEYVYHAAANVSFRPEESGDLMYNNVDGTANIVNACLEKPVKKLCFVSSTAALGFAPPGEEITEDLPWARSRTRSMYSISKFNSEMEVWRGMAEGLNTVIVNPSVIIGPGNWQRSSSYLFSAVWAGMKFYTEGITGFVDVRDVVMAMIRLMEGDYQGERFTVSSENLSYRQVLEMIARELGKKPPWIHATPFLTSVAWRGDWLLSALSGKQRFITRDAARSGRNRLFFSNRKIKETLGMEFIPVARSIRETAGMFLKTLPSLTPR